MKSKKLVLPIILSATGAQAGGLEYHQCNDIAGTQTTPTERFISNADGTVIDTATGLMWAKCIEGMSGSSCETPLYEATDIPASDEEETIICAEPREGYCLSWSDALAHAQNSELAGHTDWRLPNIKELHSIVESSCGAPALNTEVFPMGEGPDTEVSAYADQVYTSSPDNASWDYGVLTIEQTYGEISSSNYRVKQSIRLVRDIPENSDN